MRFRLRRLLLVLLSLGVPAFCQNATGRITGVVTDPGRAVVAGAKVTVVNTATGVPSETITGPDGVYQVPELPIGTYNVTVEQQGFAKAVMSSSELTINQTLRVDVRLQLGSVTESIAVEAQAAQVETVSPTLGGTVTGAPIQDLPLNGRNTLDLALTQPGVVPSPVQSTVAGTWTVAGGRPDEVAFLLDGGNNNNVVYNGVTLDPNPDMIAEFRILANNYTSEYGHSGGGVVSVVTKSGTNQLHGSLYDYLRNTDLNANDYFLNATNQPRAILNRNQFGGTFGGPVVIPKVINGRNKLFYYFGYQGQRQTGTQIGSATTVFTPAELQGNFSQAVKGGPDPKVASFLAANPWYQGNSQLAAQAIIDPARIDPVAQSYIKAGLIPTSPTGILVPTGSATNNADEYTGKVDYYLSQKDRFSLTLGYNSNPQINPFGSGLPGFPVSTLLREKFGNVTYLHTFSPTMLNEAHITAQHYDNFKNNPAANLPTFQQLGININSDGATGPSYLSFSSGGTLGFNVNDGKVADTTYSYTDTLTWIRGKQAWKAGASFAALENNAFFLYDTDGTFTFNSTYAGGSGNDLADFQLGLPSNFGELPGAHSNVRDKETGLFIQDEWKATSRVTLTIGLRYEYNSPITDPFHRTFSFISGVQSKVFVNAPLGLVFPGDPGAPTGQYFPDKDNFAPRFGFAFDPFGKGRTAIRGGFGVFYDALRGEQDQWNNGAPPFYSNTAIINSRTGTVNGPLDYLSNPYLAAGQVDPFPSTPPHSTLNFAAAGLLPFGPGIGAWINPHLRTPYVYQYNLSVQQQLGGNFVAEVGYIGNNSRRLLDYMDEDPDIIGTTTRLWNTYPGVAPQSYRSALTVDNIGHSNYNGLVSSLTKRLSDMRRIGSVFFTVGYTWSHAIDNASGWQETTSTVPYYNHDALLGNSDFDIRQRFVLSGGWELPFAKAWSSGPKWLTSGWSLYPNLYSPERPAVQHHGRGARHQPLRARPRRRRRSGTRKTEPDRFISTVVSGLDGSAIQWQNRALLLQPCRFQRALDLAELDLCANRQRGNGRELPAEFPDWAGAYGFRHCTREADQAFR
ncbi:MAG TPA: TonB-dependent receptor [Bryobacteraceae bacterium]